MAQYVLTDPLWILLLVLSVLVMLITNTRRQRKEIGLPPSSPKLPVIGNLHQIGPLRHKSLAKFAGTYGPVMLLDFGFVPVVFVSSAEAEKEVLQTYDTYFCSKPQISSAAKLTYNYADITFTPYNECWREMRKMSTLELFSQKRVQSFLPVRIREMESLIESIAASALSSEPVDLSEKFHRLTADVTFEVAFGTNLRRSKMDNQAIQKLIHQIEALLMFSAADYFPYVGRIVDRITGWQSRLDYLFKKLDEFFQQLIASDYEDFVDLMLQVEKESIASGRNWFTRNHMKGLLLASTN